MYYPVRCKQSNNFCWTYFDHILKHTGESEYSTILNNVIRISYTVSFLADGLIYITFDRRVRKKFFKVPCVSINFSRPSGVRESGNWIFFRSRIRENEKIPCVNSFKQFRS